MWCSTFREYDLDLVCWLLCIEQRCPFWPLGCQGWNMAPWQTGGHNVQGSSLVCDPFLHWSCLQTFHKRLHTEVGCVHICGGHGTQHTEKRGWKCTFNQIIWYLTNVLSTQIQFEFRLKCKTFHFFSRRYKMVCFRIYIFVVVQFLWIFLTHKFISSKKKNNKTIF